MYDPMNNPALNPALPIETVTITLDPEWTCCRRFKCGHVQHACCTEHLDAICPVCDPPECYSEFGDDHNHDDAECARILDVMNGVGVEQPDRGWDPDEAYYLSGSGELDGDPSYINYLNN